MGNEKKSLDDLTATMMAKDIVKQMFEMLERHDYLPRTSSILVVRKIIEEMSLKPELFMVSDIGNPADRYEAKMNFLKAFKVYWNMIGSDELRDATDCLYNIAYYGDTEVFGSIDHCPYCNESRIDYIGIEELSGMEIYHCHECDSYWRVDDERTNQKGN